MATYRHALALEALVLGALVAASPALAQSPDPAGARTGRNVAATGRTMPPAPGANPSNVTLPQPKPLSEAELVKAQKAAESRSKAWDNKTRRTMGSICSGC